ncbi:MAG: diaminopimelate epimerase [Gemmatimonadaceae bacterium]
MAGGRPFFKMSGSGNDFVFFDASREGESDITGADKIAAICSRRTGVGADGVVFMRRQDDRNLTIRYYNADGSLGELCGNATLCSVRLATDLGLVSRGEVSIHTDAGIMRARMADELAEIDLATVVDIRESAAGIERLDRESQLGFALVGVPHIVIVDRDVSTADIDGRGAMLRRHPSLPDGANVNFLSQGMDGEWLIRTFVRGVEGETLACGTGAVASGILLTAWGLVEGAVRLVTRSGRRLVVRPGKAGAFWNPSLKGAATLVFSGNLGEFDGPDCASSASG